MSQNRQTRSQTRSQGENANLVALPMQRTRVSPPLPSLDTKLLKRSMLSINKMLSNEKLTFPEWESLFEGMTEVAKKSLVIYLQPRLYEIAKLNLQVCQAFIDIGGDVTLQDDPYKNTALYYAVMGGYLDIVKFLIKNGAKKTFAYQNYKGNTVLMAACYSRVAGSEEVLKYLLTHGAGVTASMTSNNNGATALMLSAVSYKNAEILLKYLYKTNKLLINQSIKNHITRNIFVTALDTIQDNEMLIKLFVSYGAQKYDSNTKPVQNHHLSRSQSQSKSTKSSISRRKKRLSLKLSLSKIDFKDKDLVKVDEFFKSLKKCKNQETLVHQKSLTKLSKGDILKMPSGFCFSVSELVEWIESGGFNNKDPYDATKLLFEDIDQAYPPILKRALEAYFTQLAEKRNRVARLLHKHQDLLYAIGRAGRICYFNQISSFEKEKSDDFEYSIEALSQVTYELSLLTPEERTLIETIKDFDPGKLGVHCLLKNAQDGLMCIHGIGIHLIRIFITFFIQIENLETIVYDPLKTGLIFFTQEGSKIALRSIDNRHFPNPEGTYFKTHIEHVTTPIKVSSSLLLKENSQRKSEKYTNECQAVDMVTEDEIKSWDYLPDWRKFMTSEKTENKCFDIYYLIKVITNDLNAMKMLNPYPKFPTNPFTKAKLKTKDFLAILRAVQDNYITISFPLEIFLKNNKMWNSEIPEDKWRSECIAEFEKFARFKKRYDIDGDSLRLTSIWVDKNVQKTNSEINLNKLIDEYTEPLGASYYYSLNRLSEGFIGL